MPTRSEPHRTISGLQRQMSAEGREMRPRDVVELYRRRVATVLGAALRARGRFWRYDASDEQHDSAGKGLSTALVPLLEAFLADVRQHEANRAATQAQHDEATRPGVQVCHHCGAVRPRSVTLPYGA